MPPRSAMGEDDLAVIAEVFHYYRNNNADPGYQGYFEKKYTDAFVSFLGEAGYADAVCTGTAALYVAVASLQLERGAHVLVSPITDPGTINAVILNGLTPVMVDSAVNSYNISPEELEKRVTDRSKALIVVHSAGEAARIQEICEWAKPKGIMVIEDCSQAHGARYKGKKVGTYGDIGVFSTMYRKAHCTGGCGGIIFTKDEDRYNLIRAYADRGKPFHLDGFDEKDPAGFLFPALNLNIDELSCAIGLNSLNKLESVIQRRLEFLFLLKESLEAKSRLCKLYDFNDDFSPFFHPIVLDVDSINISKLEFANYLSARGISINPHYKYVVSEWKWVKGYLYDDYQCHNSLDIINRSFNLLFNENYTKNECDYIAEAIVDAENLFSAGQ